MYEKFNIIRFKSKLRALKTSNIISHNKTVNQYFNQYFG